MGSEADHTLLTHQRVPLAGRSYGLCGEGRSFGVLASKRKFGGDFFGGAVFCSKEKVTTVIGVIG